MDPPCDLPRGHKGDHHYPAVFQDAPVAPPPGAGQAAPPPTVIPNCAGQEIAYQPALFGELFNEEEATP